MKTYVCPKKTKARKETILDPWQALFRTKKLPPGKQYYTLCASHHDPDAPWELLGGSELHQLLKAGFLTPSQFHGIDREGSVIEKNRLVSKAFQTKDVKPPGWHNFDLVSALNFAMSEDETYNPGVINCDFICMFQGAAETVKQVLSMHKNFKQIMVVCNFVLSARFVSSSVEDLLIGLQGRKVLQKAQLGGWKINPACYVYEGTGTQSATQMCTILFYK